MTKSQMTWTWTCMRGKTSAYRGLVKKAEGTRSLQSLMPRNKSYRNRKGQDKTPTSGVLL